MGLCRHLDGQKIKNQRRQRMDSCSERVTTIDSQNRCIFVCNLCTNTSNKDSQREHLKSICTTQTANGDKEVVIGMQHKISWSKMHESKRGGYTLSSFERLQRTVHPKTGREKVSLHCELLYNYNYYTNFLPSHDRLSRKFIICQ